MRASRQSTFGRIAKETYLAAQPSPAVAYRGSNQPNSQQVECSRGSGVYDENIAFSEDDSDHFTDAVDEQFEALEDDDENESERRYTGNQNHSQYMHLDQIDRLRDVEQSSRAVLREKVVNQHLTAPKHRHASRPQQEFERGPSTLQIRLNSYAPQTQRNIPQTMSQDASPPAARQKVAEQYKENSPKQSRSTNAQVEGSPTPIRSINAQVATLAPVAIPLHLEFTAPRDFVPLESDRSPYGRRGGGDSLQLLSVNRIPSPLRKVFDFNCFNKAQSIAFRDLYETDKNVVVTAPTGAGKTAMFELAFLRMLATQGTGIAVYLAPTKALCSERATDWSKRMGRIKCKVLMMTSDTKYKLSEAQSARLIVATPEKWDLMTRRASSSDRFMSSVRLILIDEVHILRELRRGAVMEVLVSRMKAYSDKIRFIAVSATIPNACDFALWIGKRDNEPQMIGGAIEDDDKEDAAQLYTFSEAFRPCPLKKYVYGYRNPGKEAWSFDKELNNRLLDVIKSHSNNKGALVFCSTRRFASAAAESLALTYKKLQEVNAELPWTLSRSRTGQFETDDPHLQELYAHGIAFHHAGLSLNDRHAVEKAFLEGHINILCSTSSLAVGVNLPAYLVIIRGTEIFDGAAWRDYGDLDVFQMLGRAGRPQFDTEGVCVIMTQQEHKARWVDLVKGETIVESTLHHSLIEHANAEIVVRQGCSVQDIQYWLSKTFFFVRLLKHPEYYKLPGCEEAEDANEALYITSRRIMKELSEHGLIEDYDEESDTHQVQSSVFGSIMAMYGLRFEVNPGMSLTIAEALLTHTHASQTMQALMKVPRNSTLDKVVQVLSGSQEFADILLRSGEKGLYEDIREHDGIRYPPGAIENVEDKVSVILQAELAGIPIQDMLKELGQRLSVNPKADIHLIMEHAPKISRALLNIFVEKRDGGSARVAYELLRSVSGSAWDNSPAELRQINGIGYSYMDTLATANISTIDDLSKSSIGRLQLLLNRSPNQVKKFIQDARRFPRFTLSVKEIAYRVIANKGVESTIEIMVELQHTKKELPKIMCKDTSGKPYHLAALITTTNPQGQNCEYLRSSIASIVIGLEPLEKKVLLTRPGEEISVIVACDGLAGGAVEAKARSLCEHRKFPTIEVVEEATEVEEARDKVEVVYDTDSDLDFESPVKKSSKGGSSSVAIESKILRELQTIDQHSPEKNDDMAAKMKGKKGGKAKETKVVKKVSKRVYKTKEARMEEAIKAKEEENAMMAKIERYNEKGRAERKGMVESSKKKVQEEEVQTNSQKHRDARLNSEEEDDFDDTPLSERKRFRPNDWNSGTTRWTGNRESTETGHQEYSRSPEPEYDVGEDEPPLDHSAIKDEGNIHCLSATRANQKPVRKFVVIDSDSDEEDRLSLQQKEMEDPVYTYEEETDMQKYFNVTPEWDNQQHECEAEGDEALYEEWNIRQEPDQYKDGGELGDRARQELESTVVDGSVSQAASRVSQYAEEQEYDDRGGGGGNDYDEQHWSESHKAEDRMMMQDDISIDSSSHNDPSLLFEKHEPSEQVGREDYRRPVFLRSPYADSPSKTTIDQSQNGATLLPPLESDDVEPDSGHFYHLLSNYD